MTTDRELLERAASAVGLELGSLDGRFTIRRDDYLQYWNPLADDGDALRLAVKLGLQVGPRTAEAWRDGREVANIFEDDGDEETATRRAIVRAAAAMAAAPAVGAA